MNKHLANIFTVCRILGSMALLLFPAFSVEFCILYLFCGFSDMIDGIIARKTNRVSDWGGRLDTVADLVFVVTACIRLCPAIQIPLWLWIWSGGIATIKIGTIILGFVLQHQFISVHTFMNKVTGLLLFLLPMTMSFVELQYTATVVCTVATFSAIQEGVYTIVGRK
jgi:CDP-diacylglycerol--glycerol-3-phosphate 3-phosphatidyltransferase